MGDVVSLTSVRQARQLALPLEVAFKAQAAGVAYSMALWRFHLVFWSNHG